MQKPYETIRSEFLQNMGNEKTRLIVESNLTALPQFEDRYFEYINQNPHYFEIYKEWILNQSPLPFLDDKKLLFLRNEIFGNREIKNGDAPGPINWPVFFLLIDIIYPFLNRIIAQALSYYGVKESDEPLDKRVMMALVAAAIPSFIFSNPENIEKEGYPDFTTSCLEKFKIFFFGEIATPHQPLTANNDEFVKTVEQEWLRLFPYSDGCYGFEVVPEISPQDMVQYFQLPLQHKRYRYLSQSDTYKQMMNYFVSIATFKPVPDLRIKAYYRQELCKLFTPLAQNIVKRLVKNKSYTLSETELQTLIQKEISALASNFEFFYATIQNIKSKKMSPFETVIFPLNGHIAKLGHPHSNDEYPFTDYVVKKLEAKIKLYFATDSDDVVDSLDREIEDAQGKKRALADSIEKIDTRKANHIPEYDAGEESNLIGWKTKTFAGIIGKSFSTLRRWERHGYLKPEKRYEIYSKIRRKNIAYRAYTREDLPKAREVANMMENREKHQK